jgi:chitinase
VNCWEKFCQTFLPVYYDPRALSPNLDFITLQAFDFYTPKRNPKEADYPAPLYELIDRKFDENADYQVRYWYKLYFQEDSVV